MTAIGDVQALQTLTVYTSDVNSVDFAGDCVLVTGSGDKRVRVWEWQPGTGYVEAYFSPLMGHKYGVTSVKVSPQSTMLATSSIDGTTLLWNLRTGTKIHTMVQVGGEAVRVCRFSPDSTLLATAGDNGQVCIWDLIHRNLIRQDLLQRICSLCFQKHEGAVQSLSFSPDSSWLITSCTLGVLKLFSTAELIDTCTSSNQDIAELVSIDDAHDMGVVCCDFSTFQEVTCNEPYTKLYQLVSCGNDHDVKLWEVTVSQNKCEAQPSTATVQLCRVMEKHSSALTCVRFSSNGLYIASCGLDKTASSGKVVTIISGHNRYIACCAFSRDGSLLATGSNDKSVIAWDLAGNLTIDSELSRNVGTKWFVNDPEKSTMHEHDLMRNVETYANEVRLIQRLEEHNGAVNSVAFHRNNLLASASGDKLVRIWSVETEEEDGEEVIKIQEKPFSPLDAHTYSVNYVEFSPCGSMLASCSLDGTTLVWNTETGEQAKSSFVNSGTGIRVSRWSPDGTKIATAGDDEKTMLWDVETMDQLHIRPNTGTRYKEKKSLTGHGGNVMCVRFSPVHGEVLGSVATDRTARIWSVFSGSCLYVLEDHDSLVTSCAFSEDTSLFATGALDKTVLVWKVPQQLVSQSNLMDSLRNKKKRVADWKLYDTLKWLNDIELSRLSRKVLALGLTGRHLLSVSENELISRLEIEDDEEAMEILKKQLYWLKREDCNVMENIDESEIPHEFLCPITHEIMKEPVQCSDGFTYERAAINEWFLCGKYTSPMTNEPLHDTSFTPNFALRNAILTLLHGEGPQ
ncbi:WD repeat, SAM and U-box domain-containing protein 1 [Temnothorax longispinosus]|uniref:WD repeat, SAM and U-box domain-containing protein 1 n=1 Tax=Temnothorax longispinosus TaxID=300112 RepID=A0A4S2KTV9_9HYME|nr:WD repeat, SAM and U-box domain-containing protein 1 [Temnothorax longispinosus]